MTVHVIPMTERPPGYDRVEEPAWYEIDRWETNVELVVESRYQRPLGGTHPFGVAYVGPAGKIRKVFGAKPDQGPHAYMFALATAISAHPFEPAPRIEAVAGEVVLLVDIIGHKLLAVTRVIAGSRSEDPRLSIEYLVVDIDWESAKTLEAIRSGEARVVPYP